MSNPAALINDALMNLKITEEEFRTKYPDERVIFSSSGFFTYARGRKRVIPFTKKYSKKYGCMILSDRRAYFAYDKKSPHNQMNKFYLAKILVFGIISIILAGVVPFIIPQMFICSLTVVSIFLALLIFAIIYYTKKREFDLNILYSDLIGMGFFKTKMIMGKMDLLIMYDGTKTYFMIPNNKVKDDVKVFFEQ